MSSAMLASRANADTRAYDYTAARAESGVAAMRLRFLREAKDRGPGSALRSPPQAFAAQAPPLGPRLGCKSTGGTSGR